MFLKPLVMIAIPNLGSIRVELVYKLIKWKGNPNYNIVFYFPQGMQPLDNARNHCVSKFIELSNSSEDRLWFIDEDIIPPDNALDILLSHDKDVVGLLCFMAKMDDQGYLAPIPVAMRYNSNKKYQVFFEGRGLTEVDALGGGCIMVKRKVYEEIGSRPCTFHYYPDGTLSLVGDYDFCQKAQMAGFKIWVDFDNLCGHIKPIDLKAFNDLMLKIMRERHV